MKGIRVTITDLATGDSQSADIMDDYVLITAGTARQTAVQVYPKSGTHVLTVKGVKR